MRHFLGLVTISVLSMSGCAQIEQAKAMNDEAQRRIIATIPTCSTERECEVKWAAARNFVLNNSRMKFQTVTNDYLETFNSPSGEPGLAWRVVKQPQGASGYSIVGKAWCGNMFGCVPNALATMLEFNRIVTDSWSGDGPAPAGVRSIYVQ